MSKFLPGLGPDLDTVDSGVFYFIGTEKQLAELETWLQQVEDPQAIIHRLYPRDYWMDFD